jgi:hypothetical protein
MNAYPVDAEQRLGPASGAMVGSQAQGGLFDQLYADLQVLCAECKLNRRSGESDSAIG